MKARKYCILLQYFITKKKDVDRMNGLRQKQKQEPTICCLKEARFPEKETQRLK
jgi:hypothetical protein